MSDWTNTPPTEPGYYWARKHALDPPVVAHIIFYRGDWLLELHHDGDDWRKHEVEGWQFWPQRIEPPKG